MNYKPQPNFITLPLFGKKPLSGDPLTITDKNAYHFVIGSVLGDGYISKSNFNLEMEQKSVTYAFWKRTLAKEYGLIGVNSTKLYEISFMGKKAYLPLTMKKHKVQGKNRMKTNKTYYRSFSFATRAVFYDPRWRELFYHKLDKKQGRKEFRKKIPDNIADLFYSPLALAIWYLDDGTYDIAKGTIRISSGDWTNDECLVMQKCLKDNFNLETSFYMLSSTSDQPAHFYVKKKSYRQFYEHVKPTVDRLIQDHPQVFTSVGVEKKVRLEQP